MSTVLITQNVKVCAERRQRFDSLDQRLINFVMHCGYMPVPIPNNLLAGVSEQYLTTNKLEVWLKKMSPSALVLSGGTDLGVYVDRDRTENIILDYAERERIPTLGICRGMQLMAIRGNTTLHKTSGHVRRQHALAGKINRRVNSFHNFSIKSCPQNFKILARSLDGEIEAIQHKNLPMEGWMWHPEREAQFSVQDVRRLRKLFGSICH